MAVYLVPYLELIAWIAGPILAGMALRRMGVPRAWSRYLFLTALYTCQTTITALAVWVARLSEGAFLLPVLTLAGWLATTGIAWAVSLRLEHEARSRGAFIVSLCMSNNGYTLLGIVAMVLFGEAGLAQATYAQLLIIPFLVFVAFPIGRFYGEGGGRMSMRELLRQSLFDPRNLPLIAMIVGVGLNLADIPRPKWCGTFVGGLVYFGTIISGVSIGLQFRGLALRKYLRENVFSFGYRVTIYPAMLAAMAVAVGLGALDTRILILFGLVPTAIFANMIAGLFNLDTDLTNSLSMTGTGLFLAVVLPIYASAAAM
jgi:predicted permease